MTTTGDINITINDNSGGQISVPANQVQVVIGCSSAGTANQVISTRSLSTLTSTLGYGPLCEASALSINAGGTVLAIKTASNSTGSTTADTKTGTGSSVITLTSTNADGFYDDYLVRLDIVNGGTIGTAGITFKLSLDGGKSFGPTLVLGTANTYVVPQAGFTINFAAGTTVALDIHKFSVVGPRFNVAGVTAALAALGASPYAITGFGSLHIVGPVTGADATTIQTNLNTLATNYLFTRAIASCRDGYVSTDFGGAGEIESAWMSAIQTSFSALDAKRISITAGHYNTPLQFANPIAGSALVRRPLSFTLAARQVAIPPQRHAGRVRDGALNTIIVDPVTDPNDGFIYHDERLNPGLDITRFATVRTRIGLPGFYITNPNLMSAIGSDFTLLPLGNVMDIACTIVHQVGQQDINSDIRLNSNGTIYENEARSIENTLLAALKDNMIATNEISGATVSVDRTNNIKTTKTVNVTVSIVARGYILQENVSIGFAPTV